MKVLLEFVSQNMTEADANKLIDFNKKKNAPVLKSWDMCVSIIEDGDHMENENGKK